jgi:hypothetical protein
VPIAPAVLQLSITHKSSGRAPDGFALGGIIPEARADLGPPVRDWFGDWQRLTGLPDTMAGDPVADIAIALRDATRHGEPVFMATAWTYSPILVLSGRYLTGIQPVYAPGVMTTPDCSSAIGSLCRQRRRAFSWSRRANGNRNRPRSLRHIPPI